MTTQNFLDGSEHLAEPGTAVAPIREQPLMLHTPAEQTNRVFALMELAIQKGMDPASLEKLVALQERVMARQAEAEFNAAMEAFQAECPMIGKNRTADTGKYTYDYEDLAHVADTIKPYCEKYGFSYKFSQTYANSVVTIICTVKHRGGHKEDTSFTAPVDEKAVMNATQKSAGATTYGRRQSLKLAFGLSIGNDGDGRMPHDNPAPDQNAPKADTREERKKPKERDPNSQITRAEFDRLKDEYNSQQPDEKNADGFTRWCHGICGNSDRAWNPCKQSAWHYSDWQLCIRALGLEPV